jgi:hypothetical protein
VVSDSDNLSAPNLTIYSSTVYWNFTDDDYKQESPACEAYYAGTKCAECTLCANYPHSPSNAWTLSDGAVYFDCSGIESLRLCRGSTGTRADEFEPGSKCAYASSNASSSFRGVETCFVEYISPVPSQSPSQSPVMALSSSKPTLSSAARQNNPITGTSSTVALLFVFLMMVGTLLS